MDAGDPKRRGAVEVKTSRYLGTGYPPRDGECPECRGPLTIHGTVYVSNSPFAVAGEPVCSLACYAKRYPHDPDVDRQNQIVEGEALKDEGQARVLGNSPAFREQVRALIIEYARRGEPFTSTDLRAAAAVRGIAEPSHPNAWGAAFTSAAKLGIIEKTGDYEKSPVPTCHAAIVALWVGKEMDQ